MVIGDLRLTQDAEDFVKKVSTGDGKAKVLFKQTDVTSWNQLQALFDFTANELGVPDIVCPGAGTRPTLYHRIARH